MRHPEVRRIFGMLSYVLQDLTPTFLLIRSVAVRLELLKVIPSRAYVRPLISYLK